MERKYKNDIILLLIFICISLCLFGAVICISVIFNLSASIFLVITFSLNIVGLVLSSVLSFYTNKINVEKQKGG